MTWFGPSGSCGCCDTFDCTTLTCADSSILNVIRVTFTFSMSDVYERYGYYPAGTLSDDALFTGSKGSKAYYEIEKYDNHSYFNKTYTCNRQSDCTWTAPTDSTTSNISFEYYEDNGSCPSGTPDGTSSFSQTISFSVPSDELTAIEIPTRCNIGIFINQAFAISESDVCAQRNLEVERSNFPPCWPADTVTVGTWNAYDT